MNKNRFPKLNRTTSTLKLTDEEKLEDAKILTTPTAKDLDELVGSSRSHPPARTNKAVHSLFDITGNQEKPSHSSPGFNEGGSDTANNATLEKCLSIRPITGDLKPDRVFSSASAVASGISLRKYLDEISKIGANTDPQAGVDYQKLSSRTPAKLANAKEVPVNRVKSKDAQSTEDLRKEPSQTAEPNPTEFTSNAHSVEESDKAVINNTTTTIDCVKSPTLTEGPTLVKHDDPECGTAQPKTSSGAEASYHENKNTTADVASKPVQSACESISSRPRSNAISHPKGDQPQRSQSISQHSSGTVKSAESKEKTTFMSTSKTLVGQRGSDGRSGNSKQSSPRTKREPASMNHKVDKASPSRDEKNKKENSSGSLKAIRFK